MIWHGMALKPRLNSYFLCPTALTEYPAECWNNAETSLLSCKYSCMSKTTAHTLLIFPVLNYFLLL
jgi:hypothetical protein